MVLKKKQPVKKTQTSEDLVKELASQKKQLQEAHQQLRLGASTNYRKIRLIRRQIARILTQLQALKLAETKEVS